MASRNVANRRPTNIDDAPEFLNVVQVAAVLGCSRDTVRDLERDDPSFPQRRALPFTKLERFSRAELRRWIEARSMPTQLGA